MSTTSERRAPRGVFVAPLRGVGKGERMVPQHGARATLRLVRGLTRRARSMLHRLATEPSAVVPMTEKSQKENR